MGSVSDIMAMIPGMNRAGMKAQEIDPKEMARMEAIIRSMTPEERRDPDVLNARRRIRIAKGSGTSVQAVNVLIKQFGQTKQR
jgi:signal recognition particle subunit SRP54